MAITHPPHVCKKARAAFTLIELLVVIAIIAILASILFPVFGRARENARRSSCQSNLKQIGLGLMQYTQDYDERYPGRFNGNEANSWRRVIQPYVKSTQLFSCPSNTGNSTITRDSSDTNLTAAGYPTATTPKFNISYGANGLDSLDPASNRGGGTTPMRQNNGAAIASIADSAQTILVTETTMDYSEAVFSNPNYVFGGHLGTVNFLFADGHVKAMRPTQTGTPIDMWNIEENLGDGDAGLMTSLNNWQAKVK
jgi:prepilin-type N-terminal cleavage/methylation domain-containing protein/prepilin-type processing-associated H-X9-DG protein